MADPELVLVGRSSSHFTRTARLHALELGVPHAFRAVLDMTARDPAAYADSPALKIPVPLDADGPLFGTENVCRALARRSGQGARAVQRGDVTARVVANAEEMILHAGGAAAGSPAELLRGAALRAGDPSAVPENHGRERVFPAAGVLSRI